jgi:hypothetical protein
MASFTVETHKASPLTPAARSHYDRRMLKLAASTILLALVAPLAHADTVVLPESRDQQYRTFGLFIDNQTSALFGPDGNKVWLALGEQIPLVEMKDWFGSPQLVVYASVNAGDRLQASTILMETIDIRLGLSYEFSFSEKSRMSVSVEHQSGHTSDNVQDQDIVLPNLGNEEVLVRYIRDIEDSFRVGGELKPYFAADPGLQRFASDEFVEWYPWGTAATYSHFTPFIAGSMDQGGADKIHNTYNVQLGAYIGNHLQAVYKPNVRVVAGYYNGVDPRLKYMEFKDGLERFYYFGVQVGL